MKFLGRSMLAAALLGAGTVAGQPAQLCPSAAGGLCYSIAVPTSSANAGSGNIYFQIKAPASLQWAALGTGSGMAGSNIFLAYRDGEGNVTLSPRLGKGYDMPTLDTSSTAARLTLLEGSGVDSDGAFTANIACSNCHTWDGGEMSLSSTAAGWIGAWRAGDPVGTADASSRIAPHDAHSRFQVDLTRTTIDSDSNPFIARNAAEDGGSDSGSGSNSGSDFGSGIVVAGSNKSTILVAHGIILALVMAVLFPTGSLLMPLVKKWWAHAAWQGISFFLMWVGFGLGIVIARERRMLFNQTHSILGTVVIGLLAVQPVLGLVHHRHYLKTQSRGLVSYLHIWWGRILMILGVINGGLGLELARESDGYIIAYGVVSGIVFMGYFGFKAFRHYRTPEAPIDGEGPKRVNSKGPRRPYP